ncbi:MAG: EpsG family protein [Thermoplasmata archaeon]
MIYYIFPYLTWVIFCIWRILRTNRKLRLVHYAFALPLIMLVVLRGDVGTDTTTYVGYAQTVIWWGNQRPVYFEPGYAFLMRVLSILTSDPHVIINIISLLAAILFFKMLHLWEDGHCALSMILVPIYFYNFTMNGLRMGIAFPLAAIAVLLLEKMRFAAFIFFAIIAVSIHFSSVLLIPLLYFSVHDIKISYKGFIYGIFISVSVVYMFLYFYKDKIIIGAIRYASTPSPSGLSGGATLINSIIVLLLFLWVSDKDHHYLGYIFLLIQITFYGITQFTYAGIRFQQLVLFAQLLSLSYWMLQPIRKKQLFAIVLISTMAFVFTLRGFITEAGNQSAFIPYKFIWENQ